MQQDTLETRRLIWFSRILRWTLGVLFTGAGVFFFRQGGWPLLLFGGVFIVTGFLRPRRCLEEDSCDTDLPR
jgi:hypothetical protein